jgi:type II secretory pathway pseudopilin PulG
MKNSARSGTTLIELTFVLAIMAVVMGLAMPPLAAARDSLAVRATRHALVAASARARALAVHHGGTDLVIDADAGSIRIHTTDDAIDETVPLPASVAVRVELNGTHATTATLSYDALGIGRIAARTIALTRGGVSGGVTFSSYGRPREW